MIDQVFIYRRPSKWPIVTALGTAVLVQARSDSIILPIDGEDAQPIPPVSGILVPAPASAPAADFIEAQQNSQPANRNQPIPIRRQGQTWLAAVGHGKAFALNAPRPDYPYEARSRRLTGSGIAIIRVDPSTGFVTDVTISRASVIRFWIIQPSPPSAAGVSNRVHHLEFVSQLHFS